MIKRRMWYFLTLCVISILLSSGCGKKQVPQTPDLRVEVADSRGVGPGSPVKWKGLIIGQVESAEIASGGVTLAVRLDPEFMGKLRSDARARPSSGLASRGGPVLEIYGGTDSRTPLLPAGAQVPEAGMGSVIASVPFSTWVILGSVLLALLLVLVIAKGMAKLITFAMALLFLMCSFWVLKSRVQEYQGELLSPEWQIKIQELAEHTIESPEAVAAWQAIRTELAALGEEAQDQGGVVAENLQKRVEALIDAKADALREAGKEKAAEQIAALRSKSASLLQSSEPLEDETRE